ncbi:MAG: CYTH domain-containing protein [Oscillospiraceae bacterium]|nr:CYTH domain-containing protein [Oscillospiraceae bacterium]
MATELEIKYEVGDLQLLDCILCDRDIRSRMEEYFRYIRMEATYYDTEDGALSAQKQTLRLRKEDERSVITFKTASEGYARGEWEVEGQYLDEAAEELVKQGAPEHLAGAVEQGVVPVCGAKFTRIEAKLNLEGGTKCVLSGDIGELFADGKSEPLCEMEFELAGGEEAQMLAFAKMIAERYHLKEEEKSKFARARALCGGG